MSTRQLTIGDKSYTNLSLRKWEASKAAHTDGSAYYQVDDTVYVLNTIAADSVYQRKAYRCLVDHNSSANFHTDITAATAKWEEILIGSMFSHLKAVDIAVLTGEGIGSFAAPSNVRQGVTLVPGTSRILLTGQGDKSENGIYIYQGDGVALTRSDDYAGGRVVYANSDVIVKQGTYVGSRFILTESDNADLETVVIDTDDSTWIEIKSQDKFNPSAVRIAFEDTNETVTAFQNPSGSRQGVSLNTDDRILLAAQNAQSENGIWLYKGHNNPLVRPDDYNNSRDHLVNEEIGVSEGFNKGIKFYLSSTNNTDGETVRVDTDQVEIHEIQNQKDGSIITEKCSETLTVGQFVRIGSNGDFRALSVGDLSYQKTIPNPGTGSNADYLSSVSDNMIVNNDRLLVGARYSSGNGTGKAFLFYKDEGGTDNWGLKKQWDGAGSTHFLGQGLALDGNIAAIAEPGFDSTPVGDHHGRILICYKDEGGTDNWGTKKTLVNPDEDAGDLDEYYGDSIALDNNVLIAGAPADDGAANNLTNSGAVYIHYKDEGGTDNWGLKKTVYPSDPTANTGFGTRVLLNNNIAIVSATFNSRATTGTFAGAVYVFYKDEGGTDNWGQVAKIAPTGMQDEERFGVQIAFDGEILVVGAPKDDGASDTTTDCGAAYVYSKDQGGADNWGLVTTLRAPTEVTNDRFGVSVSVSDDTLLVGAHVRDSSDSVNGAGQVFLYKRNEGGTDNWGLVSTFDSESPTTNGYFGSLVSIDGDHVMIGAMNESSGTIYYYHQSVETPPDAVMLEAGVLNDIRDAKLMGHVADIFTGLTPGSEYFLDSNGDLTSTETDVHVGIAISDTALLLRRDVQTELVRNVQTATEDVVGLEKWQAGELYEVDDIVWDPADNKIYRATVAFTSDDSNTQDGTDAGKWVELSPSEMILHDAVDIALITNQSTSSFSAVGDTKDGVSLTSGTSRILLAGQTTQSENGIWVYQGHGSALTRPSDYDANSSNKINEDVMVLDGSHEGIRFILSESGGGESVTVNTDSTTWSAVGSSKLEILYKDQTANEQVTIVEQFGGDSDITRLTYADDFTTIKEIEENFGGDSDITRIRYTSSNLAALTIEIEANFSGDALQTQKRYL